MTSRFISRFERRLWCEHVVPLLEVLGEWVPRDKVDERVKSAIQKDSRDTTRVTQNLIALRRLCGKTPPMKETSTFEAQRRFPNEPVVILHAITSLFSSFLRNMLTGEEKIDVGHLELFWLLPLIKVLETDPVGLVKSTPPGVAWHDSRETLYGEVLYGDEPHAVKVSPDTNERLYYILALSSATTKNPYKIASKYLVSAVFETASHLLPTEFFAYLAGGTGSHNHGTIALCRR